MVFFNDVTAGESTAGLIVELALSTSGRSER
jgi:hypothetical protein